MSTYTGEVKLYSGKSLTEIKAMGYEPAAIGNPIRLSETEITLGLLQRAVSKANHDMDTSSIDTFLINIPQELEEPGIEPVETEQSAEEPGYKNEKYIPNVLIPIALKRI